jgi:hypothetical protein
MFVPTMLTVTSDDVLAARLVRALAVETPAIVPEIVAPVVDGAVMSPAALFVGDAGDKGADD